MNPADLALYQERYRSRLQEHGVTPQALGWMDGRQESRFAALTELLPLARCTSVLDVGCGFGDMSAYLRSQGFTGSYTGVDFVPELIEAGKDLYPDEDLRVGDIATFSGEEKFDLVTESGIFNSVLQHEDNWHHLTATLEKMFSLCRVAVTADFLSSYVDFTQPDVYYTSPEDMLGFAKGLTRRVIVRHDYLPFEFALYLFKDDRIVERNKFEPL